MRGINTMFTPCYWSIVLKLSLISLRKCLNSNCFNSPTIDSSTITVLFFVTVWHQRFPFAGSVGLLGCSVKVIWNLGFPITVSAATASFLLQHLTHIHIHHTCSATVTRQDIQLLGYRCKVHKPVSMNTPLNIRFHTIMDRACTQSSKEQKEICASDSNFSLGF